MKTQIYLEHGSVQPVTMECLDDLGIVGIVTASGWRRWEFLESESGGIADIIPALPTTGTLGSMTTTILCTW